MSKSFYNTISHTGDRLKVSNRRADAMETAILKIFKRCRATTFTPPEMHAKYIKANKKGILTSIRRAITNLTNDGYLVKFPSNKMRDGIYGEPNHVWQYKTPTSYKAAKKALKEEAAYKKARIKQIAAAARKRAKKTKPVTPSAKIVTPSVKRRSKSISPYAALRPKKASKKR